ncbi:hypothetical protein [Dyella caseinilytica]|uniref:Uncharacterized protein n=1 Tax=Dyella caseinilytica TaxID=1849581 RepID=A0ABX7GY53_9GAMM|nr:hypothetical protein [Dyella caseinilytica]QRN54901.1 hypothetical protein ISN74_05995 [Dyella caseinilytica]
MKNSAKNAGLSGVAALTLVLVGAASSANASAAPTNNLQFNDLQASTSLSAAMNSINKSASKISPNTCDEDHNWLGGDHRHGCEPPALASAGKIAKSDQFDV